MEYACLVWDPVTRQNIYALEIVQHMAARFTLGDYRTISSVTNMLQELNWNTLGREGRELYRIINQTVASQPAGVTSFIKVYTDVRLDWVYFSTTCMPTEDAFSSGHLVLSHFGTCKCSNVETYLS